MTKGRSVALWPYEVIGAMSGDVTMIRRRITPQPEKLHRNKLSNTILGPAIFDGDWYWPHPKMPYTVGTVSSKPNGPESYIEHCPFGQAGTRLWVKEKLSKGVPICGRDKTIYDSTRTAIPYKDDMPEEVCGAVPWRWAKATVPATEMPKWASRLFIEIIESRVERLNLISREDIRKHGLRLPPSPRFSPDQNLSELHKEFRSYWNANNRKGHHWDDNPWVWVASFKLVDSL